MHAELTLRFDTIDELTAALGKLAGTKALANIAVRQDTAAPTSTPAPSPAAPEKSATPAPRRGRPPKSEQAQPGAAVSGDPAPQATVGNGASAGPTPPSGDGAAQGAPADASPAGGETQATATAPGTSGPVTLDQVREAGKAVTDFYATKKGDANGGLNRVSLILKAHGKARFNELDPVRDQEAMVKILADLQAEVVA